MRKRGGSSACRSHSQVFGGIHRSGEQTGLSGEVIGRRPAWQTSGVGHATVGDGFEALIDEEHSSRLRHSGLLVSAARLPHGAAG